MHETWSQMHERVCAERYEEIIRRIWRLELVISVSAGTLIATLAGVAWALAERAIVWVH